MKINPGTRLKRPLKLLLMGKEVQLCHHEKDSTFCSVEYPDKTCTVAALCDLELVGKQRPKPIAKASEGRAKENKEYMVLRKVYLENNPWCQANIAGCTREATTVHHQTGRIGKRLIDVSTFVGLCGNCHNFCEHNSEWAKENGYSLNRL